MEDIKDKFREAFNCCDDLIKVDIQIPEIIMRFDSHSIDDVIDILQYIKNQRAYKWSKNESSD